MSNNNFRPEYSDTNLKAQSPMKAASGVLEKRKGGWVGVEGAEKGSEREKYKKALGLWKYKVENTKEGQHLGICGTKGLKA